MGTEFASTRHLAQTRAYLPVLLYWFRPFLAIITPVTCLVDAGRTARAVYDCQADQEDELSFAAGDILHDVSDSPQTGWLVATLVRRLAIPDPACKTPFVQTLSSGPVDLPSAQACICPVDLYFFAPCSPRHMTFLLAQANGRRGILPVNFVEFVSDA